MENSSVDIARWLVTFGVIFLVAGGLFYFFGDKLGWIGSLPGDIRIEKENFQIYFPVTTMILISIVLSLLLTIISRLFRG